VNPPAGIETVGASVASTGPAAPSTAHLEVAESSALVTTPEPMTQTLLATGLLAMGAFILIRRSRHRSGV
jgi:hypothetical protein